MVGDKRYRERRREREVDQAFTGSGISWPQWLGPDEVNAGITNFIQLCYMGIMDAGTWAMFYCFLGPNDQVSESKLWKLGHKLETIWVSVSLVAGQAEMLQLPPVAHLFKTEF